MKVLEMADVSTWVRDVLLSTSREKPIIAVTTRPRTESPWLEPTELAKELDGLAEIVCLETGDPTWELAEALPPRLDAYGGAVRIWWPGLRADSDSYDHRLYIIHTAVQAKAVFEELVEQVRGSQAEAEAPPAEPIAGRLEGFMNGRIEVSAGELYGELREADVPLAELARCVRPGLDVQVRLLGTDLEGRSEFSIRGLLPSPWGLAAESLSIGDVVPGRVQATRDFGAFVEVLPHVTGLVHISELDWSFVDSVTDFAAPGQIVSVKVMSMDAEDQKLELSIKRAHGTDPNPLPSLVPDGEPFTWPEDEGPATDAPQSIEDLQARVTLLTDELDAAVADRGQLAEANKRLRDQVTELKRSARSLEQSSAALEKKFAPELDSERGYLLGVRLAYARLLDEGTRELNPLRKMRVGGSFLASLRELEGIDMQKVLEVCAQVAANSAHELASREVHQIRSGPRGAGSVTRKSDGALAWRCSPQIKAASARRLHWWAIPGDSPTIEFAAVGLHDEFSIPE